MYTNRTLIPLLFVALFLISCGRDQPRPKLSAPTADEHQAYWHQGDAEINRFHLSQSRYGALHEGYAVMIFVTEPFLDNEQVKRDYGSGSAHPVLKLNFLRRFNTGIYDYSLMTSVFTDSSPQKGFTPKIAFSGQDWCGTVFSQLNYRDNHYQYQGFSYFQSEGDQTLNLEAEYLEDALWNLIRLDPNQLPQGEITIVPSMSTLRLNHVQPGAYQAIAKLFETENKTFGKGRIIAFNLKYKDIDSDLTIYFSKQKPYEILGWQHTTASGPGNDGNALTTTAVREKQIKSDYWNHHDPKDLKLRKELGLP